MHFHNQYKKLNNAMTAKEAKGKFIIGSISKLSNRVSVSPDPKIHDTRADADDKAVRLASEYRDKKFLILQVVGVVTAQDIVFE